MLTQPLPCSNAQPQHAGGSVASPNNLISQLTMGRMVYTPVVTNLVAWEIHHGWPVYLQTMVIFHHI